MAEIGGDGQGKALALSPVRITWVGRLTPIKRVDRLILAASQFAADYEGGVQLGEMATAPNKNACREW